MAVKGASTIKNGGTITRPIIEVNVQKAAPKQTIALSDKEVAVTEYKETDTAGWIMDLLQFVDVSKVLR